MKALDFARSVKRRLEAAWARWSLRTFGNSLGLKRNALYWVQHRWSRRRSGLKALGEVPAAEAEGLRRQGFQVLRNRAAIDRIAARVRDGLADQPRKNGVAVLPKPMAADLAEDLFVALEQTAGPVLRAFYGSHFQPYWSHVMRYEADGRETHDSSFAFHLDDNPRELLKVFFYLNPTREENGAFRAFDYTTTRSLLRRGFISRTAAERSVSQALITPELVRNELRVVEGDAGTVFIFDNNLIHKGTVPRTGLRDVVVIEVFPSPRPIELEDLRRSLTRAHPATDYPINPFRNDLLA